HADALAAALVVQPQHRLGQEAAFAMDAHRPGRGIGFGDGGGQVAGRRGQGRLGLRQPFALPGLAAQLPAAQGGEGQRQAQAGHHQDNTTFHHTAPASADNGGLPASGPAMSSELKYVVVIAFLILILWNLGAGLYYMIVDKGRTRRTLKWLSWCIGLSVSLILRIIMGIATGLVKPHGVTG